MIQDEFPVWIDPSKPGDVPTDRLVEEFREWMQERWNHACVVIWDACNETRMINTGEAIAQVRELDLSNRPWDNGWSVPARNTDVYENHAYHFGQDHYWYILEQLAGDSGNAGGWAPGKSPVIVNEYAWLWLNRDGSPTLLTKDFYPMLLGPDATAQQRFHLYARYLAADTEMWRARRKLAGVLHFAALAYNLPGKANGQTSDHWIDVANLKWEPEFYRYVRDAFAPIGIYVDNFLPQILAGAQHQFPILITNDLDQEFRGTVTVQLRRGEKVVVSQDLSVEVGKLGTAKLAGSLTMPTEVGDYQLVATLRGTPAGDVSSVRDITVMTPQQITARLGIAVGKPATASSGRANQAVDGKRETWWEPTRPFTPPQWIAVDLQAPVKLDRVELDWTRGVPKSYAVQVSDDGQNWKDVWTTAEGKWGVQVVKLDSVQARWVRVYAGEPAVTKNFECVLRELRVFPKEN